MNERELRELRLIISKVAVKSSPNQTLKMIREFKPLMEAGSALFLELHAFLSEERERAKQKQRYDRV